MLKRKYEYTCDGCGDIKEVTRTLDWPTLTLIDNNERRLGNWDFCTLECKDKWLKSHNFEVKE